MPLFREMTLAGRNAYPNLARIGFALLLTLFALTFPVACGGSSLPRCSATVVWNPCNRDCTGETSIFYVVNKSTVLLLSTGPNLGTGMFELQNATTSSARFRAFHGSNGQRPEISPGFNHSWRS